MRIIITNILCLLLILAPSLAHASSSFETKAKQAIMIDFDTGQVLFQKNATERMPTSSMSKVMTMAVVFEALKRGKVGLDDTFLVSERAWRKGGSKMFVEVDKRVRVEDLIRGVIIQSGNDATIVLAEGLAGTEEAFAQTLTKRAHEIGMKNSNFTNASGWPDPDHYSTARDLAILADYLIREFPEYYKYYSETEFTFSDITQANRNPLLSRVPGADGVKTGHTEVAGYGLIGSGVADGRRVIMVLNGLESSKERASESARVLEWGLRGFVNKTLFTQGQIIESVPVVMGASETVSAVLSEGVQITVPKLGVDEIKAQAIIKNAPLIAPVKKGDKIGRLEIGVPGMGKISRDLYADKDVEELGFFSGTFEKMKLYLTSGR